MERARLITRKPHAHLRGHASSHAAKNRGKSEPAAKEVSPHSIGSCACGGGCPRCQARSALEVGRPDDLRERQADAAADRIMGAEDGAGAAYGSRDVGKAASSPTPHSTDTPIAPPSVAKALSSPGSTLDRNARAFFEPRFGHEFSRVRIHTGAEADQSARDINARAYTVGHRIVFGAGQYSPATRAGQRLIAHELAHVVQQRHAAPSIMRFGFGLAGCRTLPPPAEECKDPTGYAIRAGVPWVNTGEDRLFGMADSPRRIRGPRKSLPRVEVTELVSPSVDHTGSFVLLDPVISDVTDEWELASDMPDDNHTFPIDLALETYDLYETYYGIGDGALSFLQMYIYTKSSCGMDTPTALPHSGYRITHELRTRSDGAVVAITSKWAEPVTVEHEGKKYTTTKGMTPAALSVRTVLRGPR